MKGNLCLEPYTKGLQQDCHGASPRRRRAPDRQH